MTESTDHAAGSPTVQDVVTRTTRRGIAVRKAATLHDSKAVAVYFNIRSNRDDGCTVRIADAIPQPLRGNEVEFHPKYDPVNWREADGTVVYTASVSPEAKRTTVYGIVVDDPGQLDLFSAEPAVEVNPKETADSNANGSDDGSFSFGTTKDTAGSTTDRTGDDPAVSDPEPVSATDSTGRDDGPAGDSGPIAALVSEVRRRDLTEPERTALREALDIDGFEAVRSELDALRESVETLRDEVAAADRQAADVDRIETQVEALSETLDRRHAALTDDLEDLEAALDREARWRSQLQDSIENEPGTER